MNDDREPALRDFAKLALLEKTFEKQNSTGVMPLAQRNRGVELEQRQSVRLFEPGQHAHQAVAVGIGLDDGEDLRSLCELARAGEIRGKRGEVDLREKRTGHARSADCALQWARGNCIPTRSVGTIAQSWYKAGRATF